MRNDPEFFERLYRGYEGESLVTAELYGRQLESFRLPADFGFDLVVSDAFARTFSQSSAHQDRFPWLLQVKSRRLLVGQMPRLDAKGNGRYEGIFPFAFSKLEWERLLTTENGFLVLVVMIIGEMPWGQLPRSERKPSRLAARHTGFVWFGSKQVNFLDSQLASDATGGRVLELRYRTRPTGRMREHFKALLPYIPDACAESRDKLASRMPEYGEVPMQGRDYFYVLDSSGSSRQVRECHLGLADLGASDTEPSPFE